MHRWRNYDERLDEIGITLTKMDNIQAFEQKTAGTRAWLG